MLVKWDTNLTPPAPEYVKSTRRTWTNFSVDEFIRQLQSTDLCEHLVAADSPSSIDALAEHFNTVIAEVLDDLAPVKEITLRERSPQPWADAETREARRKARRLERRFKTNRNANTKSEWITARKRRKNLARAKEAVYWKSEICSAGNNARHMWSTVDNLLGEAKSGAKPTFSPDVYHRHIDKKISDVRAVTSSAAPSFLHRSSPGLDTFKTISADDVTAAVKSSPCKQCASDPLPTGFWSKRWPHLHHTSRTSSTPHWRKANFRIAGDTQ